MPLVASDTDTCPKTWVKMASLFADKCRCYPWTLFFCAIFSQSPLRRLAAPTLRKPPPGVEDCLVAVRLVLMGYLLAA